MGFSTKVELFFSFLQFFTIVATIPSINFQGLLGSDSANYLKFSTLDAEFFDSYIPSYPKSFRIQFIIVALSLPFVLVYAALFGLNSKGVVLWFFLLLIGSVALIIGGLSWAFEISVNGFTLEITLAKYAVYGGGGLVFLCLIAALINYCINKRNTQEEMKDFNTIVEEETRFFNAFATIQRFLLGGILIFGGLLLLRVVVISVIPVEDVSTAITLPVGIVCLIFGILMLLWMFLGLFVSGRKLQFRIGTAVRDNFMLALLALMSLLYIPVATSLTRMYNCKTFSCPPGSRLPDEGSLVVFNVSSPSPCVPCNYSSAVYATCSTVSSIALGDACAGQEDSRLQVAASVRCEELQTFYWAAGGMVVIYFIIGAPILFGLLIQTSSRLLALRFPIKDEHMKSDAQIWAEKVESTSNVAITLYEPFEFGWRHCTVYFTLQKLVVVITGVFIVQTSEFSSTQFALISNGVVHFFFLLLLFFTAPFISDTEDMIGGTIQFSLSVVTSLAIAVSESAGVPANTETGIVIAVFLLPFLVGLGRGIYTAYKRSGDQDKHDQKAIDKVLGVAPAAGAAASGPPGTRANNDVTPRKQAKFGGTTVVTIPVAAHQQQEEEADANHNPLLPPSRQHKGVKEFAPPANETSSPFRDESTELETDLSIVSGDEEHEGSLRKRRARRQSFRIIKSTVEEDLEFQEELRSAPSERGGFVGESPSGATEWSDQAAVVPVAAHHEQPGGSDIVEESHEDQLTAAALRNRQHGVDHVINTRCHSIMQRYFMLAAFLGVFALACGVLGFFVTGETEMISATVPQLSATGVFIPSGSASIQHELAGYGSWDDFASNCCCMEYFNTKNESALYFNAVAVEKWVCANGNIKERVRAINRYSWGQYPEEGTIVDGFELRDMCSRSFKGVCSMAINPVILEVQFAGCPALQPLEMSMW